MKIKNKVISLLFPILLLSCPQFPLVEEGISSPSGLTAVPFTPDRIDLSWEKVDDAVNYKIFRSAKADGDFKFIESTNSYYSSYYSDHVGMLKTYYYYVTAVDIDGNESKPSEIAGSISGFSYPDDISCSSAVNGITLSWTAIEGVDSYKIYTSYYSFGFDEDDFLVEVTDNSYLHSNADSSNKYYAISSVYKGTESSLCNPVPASYTPVAVPQGFVILETPFEVTLSWEAVDEAVSYQIYKSTSSSSSSVYEYATTESTSFTDTEATTSSRYYTVAATTSSGQTGEDTGKKSAKKQKLQAPANLNGENFSTNIFKLTWDVAEYAESYDIYASQSSSSSSASKIGNTELTYFEHNISTLPAGNCYYWIKSKANGTDDSNYSASLKSFLLGKPSISSITETSGRIRVNWNMSGYPSLLQVRVYHSTSESGPYSESDTVLASAGSFTENETSPMGNYYYKIELLFNEVVSRQSSIESIAITGAVSGLSATNGSRLEEVMISWNANVFAYYYKLYYSLTENGSYSLLADNISITSYQHQELSKGEAYFYKVSGVTSEGTELPLSSADSGEAFGAAPRAPSVSSVDNNPGVIKITFYSSPGAQRYRIGVYDNFEEYLGYIVDSNNSPDYTYYNSPIYFKPVTSKFYTFRVLSIFTGSGEPSADQISLLGDFSESIYPF